MADISSLDSALLEAEVSVIGALLKYDTCIAPVLAELDASDFPSGPYKSTFQRIKSLFVAGRPVDRVTVLDAMQGGDRYAAFLRECVDLTPTAANVMEHCKVLRERTRVWRVRELAGQLAETDDPDTQTELMAKLNALQAGPRVKPVTAAEAAQDFLERMRARKAPEYLPWGLPGLDKLLEVELGDDVVLGGYSSAGKTLLSVLFAREQAKKYRVGYYSLETSTRKLVDRAMAGMSGVPLRTIKKMSYSDRELAKLTASANEYAQLQLDHIDGGGLRNVDDIINTALSRRHQIIYIDYLQILTPEEGPRGLYERVTALSQTLHRAAQAHGITVVLLSQLTRPETVKHKPDVPIAPTMNSYKNSGQIENDADVAMLLYLSNPSDYQSPRILKVAKNKDGPRDQFVLGFDGPIMTMTQMPQDKTLEIMAELAAKGRAAKQKNRAAAQMQFSELTGEDPDMPF